jgi:hypothetical protein
MVGALVRGRDLGDAAIAHADIDEHSFPAGDAGLAQNEIKRHEAPIVWVTIGAPHPGSNHLGT